MQEEKAIETGIMFSIDHQFGDSQRLGKQIFWHLCKDFNIAAWMEQYYPRDGENKKKFTIDVVDVRQLKKTQQPNIFGKNQRIFLIQDHKDDDDRIKDWLSDKYEESQLAREDFIIDKLAQIKQTKVLITTLHQVKNAYLRDKPSLEAKDIKLQANSSFDKKLASMNQTKELLDKLEQLKNEYARVKAQLQDQENNLQLSNIKGIRELVAKMKTVEKDDGEIKGGLQAKDNKQLQILEIPHDKQAWIKDIIKIAEQKQLYLYVLLWRAGVYQLNIFLTKEKGHFINSYDQLDVTFFLKTQEKDIHPYFIIKQRLNQSPVANLRCQWKEFIFDPSQNQLIQYKIIQRGNIDYLKEQQLRLKQMRGIDNGNTIKVLHIDMEVDRLVENVFGKLGEQNELKNKQIYYDTIQYNCARNKFTYLKKNLILREGKKFPKQHYNLAFQGGGAKGFAYVGAYKALEQHRINENEKIPIKSIMGSSAGGIVAIAASTGISWRQIEAICYKMNTIPATDRIKYALPGQGSENTDQFGNEISFQTLQHDFKRLFNQYGIMTQQLFNVFSQFLKGDKFRNKIQQKLVKILKIMNPSISQIFQIKQQQIVQRTVFNWSGLAFHGALMKGEAIHKIAAECIIRYFIKQIADKGKLKLQERLEDAFRDNPLIMNQDPESLPISKYTSFSTAIDSYLDAGRLLFNAKIGVLVPQAKRLQFLVYLINSTLFKLNIQCSQLGKGKEDEKQGSVNIGELKYNNFRIFFTFKQQEDNSIVENLQLIKKNRQTNLQLIKNQQQYCKAEISKIQSNPKIRQLSNLKDYQDEISQIQQNIKIKQQQGKYKYIPFLPNTKREQLSKLRATLSDLKKQREQLSKLRDTLVELKIKQKQLPQLKRQEEQFIAIVGLLTKQLTNNKDLLQYFIRENLKADIRQIMEQLSSMNENNQNNQIARIRQITEKLKKIIETTAQNQHKFQSILPFTKRLFAFQAKIKYLLACRTYNQINAVSNTTNFINHQHLELAENKKIQDITVKQFLQDCFVNKGDPNKLIGLSEKKIAINKENKQQAFDIENFEIDKVIFDYISAKDKEKKVVMSKQIIDYGQAYENLVSACQTMTMKEYYALTGIELTCTSVDMDDHILRLFNHKTTPNLPVCRAIQMTGSFPVAFKAQRWRPEWGLYHVQKKGRMVSIDITGHQFTDGGLLANFPIKYFDNPYISDQYFAHTREEGKTIMLGFGLDMLEPGYQLSQEEVEKANMVNVQKAKAFAELQEIFPIKSLGFSIFKNSATLSCSQNEIKLGELDRLIHEKIPLFRFLSKLVRAYPNADRNLNIQAFENRVFMVDMKDTNDSPTSQYLIKQQAKNDKKDKNSNNDLQQLNLQRKWDLQNYFRQFKKFKIALQIPLEKEEKAVEQAKKQVNIAEKEVKKSGRSELQQKKRILKQKVQDLKKKQQQLQQQKRDLGQSKRIEKEKLRDNMIVLKNVIEDKLNGLETIYKDRIKNIKQGHRIYYQDPIRPLQTIKDPVKEQQMSRYLLKILRTTLRNHNEKESKSNKEINDVLSERYLFLKYIAERKELQGTLKQGITLEKELIARPKFNETNLRNLFDSYDLEEIQKHLNFKKAKQDYIKAAKEQGLSAEDLSNPNKMTSQVKERLFNVLNRKLNNQSCFFVNPYQFSVSQSLRRLTQYVFLQVKCQLPIYKNNIQKLSNIIKNTEYSQLISDQSSDNSKYLTFNEILDLMCKLANKGLIYKKKLLKINFQPRFLAYLNEIKNSLNEGNRNSQNISRIKKNLIFDLKQLIKKSQITKQNIEKRKLIPQLQETMKQIIDIPQVISFSTAILKLQEQQQSRETISSILKGEDKELITKFLNFILNRVEIRAEKTDLTVFNEGHIKSVQQNSLKTLKQSIFGSKYGLLKYQNANFINNQLKKIQEQINQLKQTSLGDLEQHFNYIDGIIKGQNATFAPIQRTMMKYFYNKTLQKYIEYRIQNKQKKEQLEDIQSSTLKIFNKLYLQDLGYVLKFIRTLALLLINQTNIKDKKKKDNILLPDHQPKYGKLLKKLTECYFGIFDNFNDRYQQLSNSSENQISLETINRAFLVKLKSINDLIESLGQLKQIKCFDIDQTINNFTLKNFSLPLFNIDISNLFKYLKISYDSAIDRSAIYRKTLKVQDKQKRNVPYIYKRQILVTRTFDQEVKDMKHVYGDTSEEINLHLLLEGIGNSSDYYSSFFQFIQKFMNRKLGWDENQEKKQIKLKQISCSGFHSIFGFLLTLGKDIEVIREEMYRIRQYAYQKFDGDKINQFFKNQGHYSAVQNYASLSKSLTVELSTVFQRFQPLIKQKPQKYNYQKCFNDIRLLIQQQQRYYTQSCNKILDESMLTIKNIQNKYIDPVQPKQIAKTFAFDYTCGFDKRHQYNKDLKKTKQMYFYIVNQMFEQFGDILSAVICDTIASNSPLIIEPNWTQQFTKGKLIGRMLTVYKLKAFIYEQLQAHGLPRNITLNEYFKRSKPDNQIVLNFLCVNVSEQRLQMLNKMQTPKMPLWAAILAASSLPIIHRNFWCEREWEELEISDKYHEIKRLQFFGNKESIQRKKTFYNSSFYISSLPIELITNSTINNQIKTYDNTFTNTLGSLYFLAVAFNPKYSGNLSHHNLKRKYMKITLRNAGKAAWNKISSYIPSISAAQCDEHHGKSYDTSFGTVSALLSGLKTNSALNTFGTLSEANDNFIMKWYFNRLIKLPIKFGTLEFGEIVDEKVYKTFKIQIPSSKAHETTLRSYHITKTFIHNIEYRPSSNIQRFNPDELKNECYRYIANIRASIIKVPNSSSGYDKDYYSIVFINHSKWNRNIYNNFVIEYAVHNDHQDHSINTKFKRADNSEISWEAELSTKIKVRFYYLSVQYDQEKDAKGKVINYKYDSKATKILFTEFILDFNSLNKFLPFRPSFDYSFNFTWDRNCQQLKEQGQNNQNGTEIILNPYKMNNGVIPKKSSDEIPQLIVKIVEGKPGEKEIHPYLQRSNFRFPSAP